eukprot:CAMPEP_0114507748 /NCGR_PEP_ID=MMETSP0109-20121206/12189_1 /TAXON_ID=29199 /ORGANISM="Chlorarachnion reptans, Strain CCCM449" /LENGTH=1563 /DNA_ID=CAMNT_0001686549 /DNA_START=168 /DNA_END=4859 /DNA_ORIENTATION=+
MNKWYQGTVDKWDEEKGNHHIVYTDGDKRWTRVRERTFRIIGLKGQQETEYQPKFKGYTPKNPEARSPCNFHVATAEESKATAAERNALRAWLSKGKGKKILDAPIETLRFLVMWDSKIYRIPSEIRYLTSLKILYINNNKLKNLPPEIRHLIFLSKLHLQCNQLMSLPSQIRYLSSLSTLLLNDNNLTSLPSEIKYLTSLVTLNVSRNRLTSIPTDIQYLCELTTLYLEDNQITSLPAEIEYLSNLSLLSLEKNSLTVIPAEIQCLHSLKILLLGDNMLTSLPKEIQHLTDLKTLWLNANRLTYLPAEMQYLSSLKSLHVKKNKLTSLPKQIQRLQALSDLRIDPDVCIPEGIAELLGPDFKTYKDWTLDVEEFVVKYGINDERVRSQKVHWKRQRLMLIGEGRSGKTSLIKSLKNFPFSLREKSTELADLDPDILFAKVTSNNNKPNVEGQLDVTDHHFTNAKGFELGSTPQGTEFAVSYISSLKQNLMSPKHIRGKPVMTSAANSMDESRITRASTTESMSATHNTSATTTPRTKTLNTSATTTPRTKTRVGLSPRSKIRSLFNIPLDSTAGDELKTALIHNYSRESQSFYVSNRSITTVDTEEQSDSERKYSNGPEQTDSERKHRNYPEQTNSNSAHCVKSAVASERSISNVTREHQESVIKKLDNLSVRDVTGDSIRLAIWDCAGQSVYYLIHSMFLQKQGGVYIVVFSLESWAQPESRSKTRRYLRRWFESLYTHAKGAPFLIVATHLDEYRQRFVSWNPFVSSQKKLMVGLRGISDEIMSILKAIDPDYGTKVDLGLRVPGDESDTGSENNLSEIEDSKMLNFFPVDNTKSGTVHPDPHIYELRKILYKTLHAQLSPMKKQQISTSDMDLPLIQTKESSQLLPLIWTIIFDELRPKSTGTRRHRRSRRHRGRRSSQRCSVSSDDEVRPLPIRQHRASTVQKLQRSTSVGACRGSQRMIRRHCALLDTKLRLTSNSTVENLSSSECSAPSRSPSPSSKRKSSRGHYLHFDDVCKIASKHGVNSAKEVEKMLATFHALGVIAWFNEDIRGLKDHVVVDLQWLIDCISHVIWNDGGKACHRKRPKFDNGDHEKLWEKYASCGILDKQLLKYLWPREKPLTRKFLFGLLEKYRLVAPCRIKKTQQRGLPQEIHCYETFIVPSMLPIKMANKKWYDTAFQHCCEIVFARFMPQAFFEQMIGRTLTRLHDLNFKPNLDEISRTRAFFWVIDGNDEDINFEMRGPLPIGAGTKESRDEYKRPLETENELFENRVEIRVKQISKCSWVLRMMFDVVQDILSWPMKDFEAPSFLLSELNLYASQNTMNLSQLSCALTAGKKRVANEDSNSTEKYLTVANFKHWIIRNKAVDRNSISDRSSLNLKSTMSSPVDLKSRTCGSLSPLRPTSIPVDTKNNIFGLLPLLRNPSWGYQTAVLHENQSQKLTVDCTDTYIRWVLTLKALSKKVLSQQWFSSVSYQVTLQGLYSLMEKHNVEQITFLSHQTSELWQERWMIEMKEANRKRRRLVQVLKEGIRLSDSLKKEKKWMQDELKATKGSTKVLSCSVR